MRLSELIDKLNKIKSEEGNLLVVTPGIDEFNYKEVRLVATLNVAKITGAILGFGEEYLDVNSVKYDPVTIKSSLEKAVVVNW